MEAVHTPHFGTLAMALEINVALLSGRQTAVEAKPGPGKS